MKLEEVHHSRIPKPSELCNICARCLIKTDSFASSIQNVTHNVQCEKPSKEKLHHKLERCWVPVAKLSRMLLRPEAGTIVSIFYYFYLFIFFNPRLDDCEVCAYTDETRSIAARNWSTGQACLNPDSRETQCWLISWERRLFSGRYCHRGSRFIPLTFFPLYFLYLQFLLVQILCKGMFFNVLLGNVVCVFACARALPTSRAFAIHDCWFSQFCISLGVGLSRRDDNFCTVATVPPRCHWGLQNIWPSDSEKSIDVAP